MIDIAHEQVRTLSKATEWLPPRRENKRAHSSTLSRWGTSGLNGVFLETIRVGGVTCTSLEALQRFFDQLTAKANAQVKRSADSCTPTPEDDAVERELDRHGL